MGTPPHGEACGLLGGDRWVDKDQWWCGAYLWTGVGLGDQMPRHLNDPQGETTPKGPGETVWCPLNKQRVHIACLKHNRNSFQISLGYNQVNRNNQELTPGSVSVKCVWPSHQSMTILFLTSLVPGLHLNPILSQRQFLTSHEHTQHPSLPIHSCSSSRPHLFFSSKHLSRLCACMVPLSQNVSSLETWAPRTWLLCLQLWEPSLVPNGLSTNTGWVNKLILKKTWR